MNRPEDESERTSFGFVEEALHALDRYRLFGRELEVEFARGDRKSKRERRKLSTEIDGFLH